MGEGGGAGGPELFVRPVRGLPPPPAHHRPGECEHLLRIMPAHPGPAGEGGPVLLGPADGRAGRHAQLPTWPVVVGVVQPALVAQAYALPGRHETHHLNGPSGAAGGAQPARER
ncbi:hypothetical protein GCM10010358_78740 [Streptomyces minutiscleroticus]|uniref:Uncharacterized protein n=1 Tax=Streptomyces minutiscleroticus TaxID=68238 RepID=A0A918UA42_9ACTN|nr:hypothetical protein GCM10010358_78740 [Streptomyces minutiscleroticus]